MKAIQGSLHCPVVAWAGRDEDNRELGQLAIQAAANDARVLDFHDGKALAEFLTEGTAWSPAPCDLVFVDLSWPGLDTLRVLEKLRNADEENNSPFPPIVLVSPRMMPGLLIKTFLMGASGCLHTDLSVPEFLEDVRATTEFWLNRNDQPGPGPQNAPPTSPCTSSFS